MNMSPSVAANRSSPLHHVFVDFENVHEIDLAVIGNKTVSFTLLVGPRQTKLDVRLAEKLFEHASSVQLVRLASIGRNALDFILTYYVGRAVAFDPTGCFHIVSRDTGFDPLVEHLQSKRIQVSRHDGFASLGLAFGSPAKASAPSARTVDSKPKSSSKRRTEHPGPDERTTRVWEHLRKPSATHPKNKKKLVSHLVAHLGHKITEAEALNLVGDLQRHGHISIGEKGAVAYHLEHE